MKIDDILKLVADETGFEIKDIQNKNRKQELILARHLFFYLAKKYTSNGLQQIADVAGGRAHTTVMYGIHHIKNLITTNDAFCYDIHRIEAICNDIHRAEVLLTVVTEPDPLAELQTKYKRLKKLYYSLLEEFTRCFNEQGKAA